MGRLTRHTPELAEHICRRLAAGETLRAICRDDEMPSAPTVRLWVLEDREGFADQYARAREVGYHMMAEEVIELSDDSSRDTIEGKDGDERANSEWIARSRLRFDARRWLLSKALPKIYGDKLELGGPGGGPLVVQVVKFEPDDSTE